MEWQPEDLKLPFYALVSWRSRENSYWVKGSRELTHHPKKVTIAELPG